MSPWDVLGWMLVGLAGLAIAATLGALVFVPWMMRRIQAGVADVERRQERMIKSIDEARELIRRGARPVYGGKRDAG